MSPTAVVGYNNSCLASIPLAGFELSLIGRFSGVPRGHHAEMGNLLSLYPKIHCLDADAQVCRCIPNRKGDLFLSQCNTRRRIVAQIGLREMLSHTLLYGILSIPQNELPLGHCPGPSWRVGGPAGGAPSLRASWTPRTPRRRNGKQDQADVREGTEGLRGKGSRALVAPRRTSIPFRLRREYSQAQSSTHSQGPFGSGLDRMGRRACRFEVFLSPSLW